MDHMKELLLTASDNQLDASMFPLIEKWSDPFKAIEILEVLDKCIYGSLASDFTISVLQILYDKALAEEGLAHEELIKDAIWRKDLV